MVDQLESLDDVFHALANSARRDMLHRLAEHPLTVGELAQPLTISLAATSKHIKVLERAGLVAQTVSGRRHLCHLVSLPLLAAADWIQEYERFWGERLDALEGHFRPAPTTDAPVLDAPAVDKEDK